MLVVRGGDVGVVRVVVMTDGGAEVVSWAGGVRLHCGNVALMVVSTTSVTIRR